MKRIYIVGAVAVLVVGLVAWRKGWLKAALPVTQANALPATGANDDKKNKAAGKGDARDPFSMISDALSDIGGRKQTYKAEDAARAKAASVRSGIAASVDKQLASWLR